MDFIKSPFKWILFKVHPTANYKPFFSQLSTFYQIETSFSSTSKDTLKQPSAVQRGKDVHLMSWVSDWVKPFLLSGK